MELQELKNIWSEYDKKLDKSLQLNMQLLRKMNLDKVRFKMRSLFAIKIFEICWLFFCVSYLANFTARYFSQLQFSIPAIIMGLIIIAYLILDIIQLSIVIQLQVKSSDEAIAPLQRKIGMLKYLIVSYVKYSLFLIPLYPLLLILIGKIFLNIDFASPRHITYLIVNIVVGACLLPLFIWVFLQLSKKEDKPAWIKNVLAGSGWNQANDAGEFLNEITRFEKED